MRGRPYENGCAQRHERLARYEMTLWQQTVEIILLLNSINRAAKDEYADCDDKYLHLKNAPRKRRGSPMAAFYPLHIDNCTASTFRFDLISLFLSNGRPMFAGRRTNLGGKLREHGIARCDFATDDVDFAIANPDMGR